MLQRELASNDTAAIRLVLDELDAALDSKGWIDRDRFAIRLAMEEAMTNGAKHGNRYDPSKKVRVTAVEENGTISLSITDEGSGFDKGQLIDPLSPEGLERDCGRGLLLMSQYMTDVEHVPPGNRVIMRKERSDLRVFAEPEAKNGL